MLFGRGDSLRPKMGIFLFAASWIFPSASTSPLNHLDCHERRPMIELFTRGGWMMIPLVICSVVALAVILERAWFFIRHRTGNADHMLHLIQQGKFTDALLLQERESTPLLRVLAAGVLARQHHPAKAMEAQGLAELSVMRKGLSVLDTIITLAPLLGLLGTIIGMINSFGIMAESGIGQPHAVTGGVAEALICTAAGIFIAVMTLIPYNYFMSKVERETTLLEEYATRAEAALAAHLKQE
ncbi:MAG: MotA/TolQ/ExbB proton channel family protein [Nitrospirae bacterium]|nr:MAG: MotA/TolQ/ExbB proton channel family protein [Nitrospirota bacterium]